MLKNAIESLQTDWRAGGNNCDSRKRRHNFRYSYKKGINLSANPVEGPRLWLFFITSDSILI